MGVGTGGGGDNGYTTGYRTTMCDKVKKAKSFL
jgi:hypothetical protein